MKLRQRGCSVYECQEERCWAKVLGLCSMLGGAKGGGNDVTGGGTCSQQRRHRQDSQPKRAPISAAFLEKEGERARIAMSCSAHPRRIVHSALANSVCYCYPCTQFFPWQIEDRKLMGALHHNTGGLSSPIAMWPNCSFIPQGCMLSPYPSDQFSQDSQRSQMR